MAETQRDGTLGASEVNVSEVNVPEAKVGDAPERRAAIGEVFVKRRAAIGAGHHGGLRRGSCSMR